MEMKAKATKIQSSENELKQLMADVSLAMEKAQEAVAGPQKLEPFGPFPRLRLRSPSHETGETRACITCAKSGSRCRRNLIRTAL